MNFSSGYLEIQKHFHDDLKSFHCESFGGKVDTIQSPYGYAFNPYACYVEKYLTKKVPVLFLGLNAGPHGMCKTGLPFGDIKFVTNFLGITGYVQRKNPQTGKLVDVSLEKLTKERGEVSGSRFWGLVQNLCGTPEEFFENCFVYNYCPLAFSHQNKNVNPSSFRVAQRRPLESVCDDYLVQTICYLGSRVVVAIGNYAETRANAVRNDPKNPHLKSIEVIKIRHPSPLARLNEEQWRNHVEETIKNSQSLKPYLIR